MYSLTKMSNYLLFVVLVITTHSNVILAKVAPDFITPCPGQKSDCLQKEIQKDIPIFAQGIPSLGVIPLDPLYQDYVRLDLPGGLKIELFKGNVYGLKKCIIDSVSYKDDEANLQFHCNITFKGKYKANGKIIIVTIDGDGDAKVKISNVILNLVIKFHDVSRNGEVYQEIKDYDVKYRIADRVSFSLTNLFQGNPELSETVLTFLNENWKPIADEFGGPIFTKLFDLVYGAIKKFFESVPKKEFFGDK